MLEGKTVVYLTAGVILGQFLISLASHREEGSCHAVTIELLPQQKLDMTNQIRTSYITSVVMEYNYGTMCLAAVSIL